MKCGRCSSDNDQDAVFCGDCGNPIAGDAARERNSRRRSYWYALLLLLAAAIAAAVGYFKFFLPAGIAAVVNGEEITLSEIEGLMPENGQASAEMRVRMRYAILSDLITERIAWQEAKKAGITITAAAVNDAYDRARMSSGRKPEDFRNLVASRYGSEAGFRAMLERRTGIRKYIAERLTAGTADPDVVDERTSRWLQDAAFRSTVRIALAEQAPASGCGCCNNGSDGADRQGRSVQAREAQRAALAYWAKKHGDGPVDTQLTDYGCHVQVDIIKDKKIAKSLRFQNGAITEM